MTITVLAEFKLTKLVKFMQSSNLKPRNYVVTGMHGRALQSCVGIEHWLLPEPKPHQTNSKRDKHSYVAKVSNYAKFGFD
jgi:hypothetical protein